MKKLLEKISGKQKLHEQQALYEEQIASKIEVIGDIKKENLRFKNEYKKLYDIANNQNEKLKKQNELLRKYKTDIKNLEMIKHNEVIYKNKIQSLESDLKDYYDRFGHIKATTSKENNIDDYDTDKSFFEEMERITGNPFNKDQISAIRYDMENHMRIIAGAGSGKTETICAKVAYLVQMENVNPKEICMITFTRKAKEEMEERIHKFIGDYGTQVNVGTFHSTFRTLYAMIIKKLPELASMGIDVKDPEDGKYEYNNLLNHYIRKYNLHSFNNEGENKIGERLDYWFNSGASFEDIKGYVEKHFDAKFSYNENIFSEYFYKILVGFYNKRKQQKIGVFDDYINNILQILSNDETALKMIREKYKYIFIDEFQDTNPIQMKIVNLICPQNLLDNDVIESKDRTKLIIVGDDDQSIYGFRGSDPIYIKDFEKYYKVHTIELMTNYRSANEIVKAGNRGIAFNKNNRVQKSMIPFHKKPGDVGTVFTENLRNEAKWIIRKSQQIGMSEDKIDYTQTVVLYRSRHQVETLINELHTQKVPFVIDSEIMGVFNDPTFKSIFESWVELFKSRNSWRKIVRICALNYFIKEQDIKNFISTEQSNNPKNLLDFIQNKTTKYNDIKPLRNYLSKLYSFIVNKEDRINLFELIEDLFKFPKLKNLSEESKEQMTTIVKDNQSFEKLYQYYQLLKKENEVMKDNLARYYKGQYNGILLTTIHSSKGLAFPNVIVIGCYSGGLPSSKSIVAKEKDLLDWKEKAEPVTTIEEERRLMYVAVTRAKKSLYLTCPKTINDKPIKSSMFLKEFKLPIVQ